MRRFLIWTGLPCRVLLKTGDMTCGWSRNIHVTPETGATPARCQGALYGGPFLVIGTCNGAGGGRSWCCQPGCLQEATGGLCGLTRPRGVTNDGFCPCVVGNMLACFVGSTGSNGWPGMAGGDTITARGEWVAADGPAQPCSGARGGGEYGYRKWWSKFPVCG